MSLQRLKQALIAYTSNTAKAIWSVVAHPLTIVGSKNGNVKDYKIYGNTIDGVSVGAPDYHFTVVTRGKNYFDLDKVPFSNSSTQPYNNGLKAMKLAASNRGDKIPIDLPVGKTIYLTLDVVDSQINGTSKQVTLGFYNSKGTRIHSRAVPPTTVIHKVYSFTLTEEVKYIQFYFQANDTNNAVGDYVTMDNIMFRTEGEDVWEPYVTPINVDIYLNRLLASGDVIQMSVDGLPPLPQFKGTTTYEVMTDVPPSGIQVQYYG
jgi:hypothetical protein